MRLPVTPQISTKDGLSNKNARLTNCLKESKKSGDKAVVRPGLVMSDTYTGLGNGLIPFDGRLLVIYDDTVTDIEEDTLPWPLDSDPWAAGTTYGYGDTVWYGDVLFFSKGSGNVGNTPGSSTQWDTSTPIVQPDNYEAGTAYAINDSVISGGITYYSNVAGNTGHTPASNPEWWSTSPIGTSRYQVLYVTGRDSLYKGIGPQAGSREGAGAGAYSLCTPFACSEVFGQWHEGYAAPNFSGGTWFANCYWNGGTCASHGATLGPSSIGIITQVV